MVWLRLRVKAMWDGTRARRVCADAHPNRLYVEPDLSTVKSVEFMIHVLDREIVSVSYGEGQHGRSCGRRRAVTVRRDRGAQVADGRWPSAADSPGW
jgi:hypothetical protein